MPSTQSFTKRSHLDQAAAEVFAWHVRPGAFERLTPPWSGITVESRTGEIQQEGSTVVLRMPAGPFGLRWVARHSNFQEGRSFCDEQVSGPFAKWQHSHLVEEDGDGSTLTDRIEYRLPLAPLSTMLAGSTVQSMLQQTFDWRHRRTREDLEAHARAGLAPSRIAITGANGLVGRQLDAFLGTAGHEIQRVVRRSTGSKNDVLWNPADRILEKEKLEGVDAVVHLAGESIASGRWSAESKKRVLSSRIEGTRLLCETLAALDAKPRVLVSASAIGFYGDCGERSVDETSESGDDFLADVCRQWEQATAPAREAGIRVVNLRIGIVLTPLGGALAQMLPPFRMGVGGTMGSGEQWMSWIGLDDLLGAILHCIANPALTGPVNATAPCPVSNADFTRTLGALLHRPTVMSLPAFALRAALGEMADSLLLSSCRAEPHRLLESGFVYRNGQLRDALADMLGRAISK